MVRVVLAVFGGVVAGAILVGIFETIGHLIFPPPEGVDLRDPEALKSIMSEIPLGAKLSVVIAWGIGVCGGGVVARLIARQSGMVHWVVAGIFAIFIFANLLMIPHPVWMVASAVLVTVLGAYAAGRLIR